MRIRPYELTDKIRHELPEVIYISGDEPLLLDEASQQYIAKASVAGFTEREVVYIDSKFNFSTLYGLSGNLSLFAARKLIILKLETLKLGTKARQFVDWLDNLHDEISVLVQSGKIDTATQKTSWFKKLDSLGWIVQIWPVELDKLPSWIVQRARLRKLDLDFAAAEVLAYKVEGNLLAAKQELDKLELISQSEKITTEMVLNLTSDSSHYDVFQLVDSALQNNPARTIKIFKNLIGEGVALQVIIWALAKDLRELLSLKFSGSSPAAHKAVEYMHPAIWKRRMPLFSQALGQNTLSDFEEKLRRLLMIDKASKGLSKLDAEIEMERWFL